MIKETKNIYSQLTFIILFIIIIFLFYKIIAPYFLAIAIGYLLALIIIPFQKHNFFNKIKPKNTAYIIMFGLIIIILLPLIYFVTSFIQQAIQVETFLNNKEPFTFSPAIEFINRLPLMNHFFSNPQQLQTQIDIWISDTGTYISNVAIKTLQEIPYLLLQTFFCLLSCLVFLTESKRFSSWMSDKIPLRNEIKKSLIESFRRSSTSALLATMAASGTQALAIFITFLTLNIPAAFLAAGLTFIFNFLPVIGAAPFWVLGFLYLYWKGSYIKLILLLIISLLSSLFESIVRVFVIKGQQDQSTLLELIAVFGGLQVFGFFGVIIGPIILAVFISMCEVWPKVWKENS